MLCLPRKPDAMSATAPSRSRLGLGLRCVNRSRDREGAVADDAAVLNTLFPKAVHHLEHVAMSQDGGGVALHDIEIGAGEADALFRGGGQGARLGDQTLGLLLGSRRRFLRQRLID